MVKKIVLIMIMALSSPGVWAQEGNMEKDPFHPAEGRPAALAQPSADTASWGRDPFSSPLEEKTPIHAGAARQAGKRMLTGIIYSKQARVAIINGEALREGSMVGDKKLVDIRRRSVVFLTASGGFEEVTVEDFSIGK